MPDAVVVPLTWAMWVATGLVVGSFLTVVVHRVPRHESIVRPRSRCPGCGAQVAARDNVPVVSWLLLRGRCRGCGTKISVRYPLTEGANAGLWVVSFARFGDDLFLALVFALFFSFLLAASLIDIEHRIIPNALTYPGVPVFLALVGVADLLGEASLPGALLGGATYAGGLLLMALVYPKGMGMGDVKLAAVIGVVLGSLGPLHYVLPAALFAFFLGAVGGIAAMVLGSKGRKSAIPFGPFMAAGALAAVFVGPAVMDWYLAILGA